MGNDRKLVFKILQDVELKDSWSNLALNSHIKRSGAESPAFVRELVYGVLRNQILLDSNVDSFLSKPNIKTADRLLLRMGFYQIARMNSVTEYAAVNETVELAKEFAKGREKMINAVLRNFIRRGGKLEVPKGDNGCTEYSSKPWIYELWKKDYGAEFAKLLLCESNKQAELSLRVNTLKFSREDLCKRLQSAEPGSFAETSLIAKGGEFAASQEYKDGFFSIQSRMSQYAVQLLGPRPGETIIDLCAAPGGKSCAAAERMQNKGKIYAFDLYEKRIGLINNEAQRLGINIIETKQADASKPFPMFKEKSDRVLCDVPCSGLGTIRRKPEIKLKDKPEDFEKLPKTQLAILKNGAELVASCGRLMYSTCTINKAENEQVCEKFLKENKNFKRIFEKQFFPQDAGDGFYICLMEREA